MCVFTSKICFLDPDLKSTLKFREWCVPWFFFFWFFFASVSAGGRVCWLFLRRKKKEKNGKRKKKVAAVCRYLSLSVGAHPSPRLSDSEEVSSQNGRSSRGVRVRRWLHWFGERGSAFHSDDTRQGSVKLSVCPIRPSGHMVGRGVWPQPGPHCHDVDLQRSGGGLWAGGRGALYGRHTHKEVDNSGRDWSSHRIN